VHNSGCHFEIKKSLSSDSKCVICWPTDESNFENTGPHIVSAIEVVLCFLFNITYVTEWNPLNLLYFVLIA